MRNSLKREELVDWLIPFLWNRWFQIGSVLTLAGVYMLCRSVALWFAGNLHTGNLAGLGLYVLGVGVVLLSTTEFGKATVMSYQTTRGRIEDNEVARAEGEPEGPNTWELRQYAPTYCGQIGVKAAASEFGFVESLPHGYANLWRFALHGVPYLAWALLCSAAAGLVPLFFSASFLWQVFGGLVTLFSMLMVAYGQKLKLWRA